MCYFYLKIFMLYYILLICICAVVKSDNNYRTSTGKFSRNTKDVVLHDMYMAFSPIAANNSNATIENVVSHMYNLQSLYSATSSAKSSMIFKLPIEPDNQLPNEKTVFMERQQFIEPTFPNLTRSYMTLRRFKLSKQALNSNISELMLNEMRDIYRQPYDDDAWSHLGLSGWNGDVAQPTKSQDHVNNKLTTNLLSDYPLLEITKDLTESSTKSGYKQELMVKNEREKLMKEMDKNVFIARANDPFGYSTKWQMRQSNQTKTKRDVLRLYSMIKCSTGCEPLVYKGYGCFCGFLGHGVPADGIDRCCKLHDKCYEHSNCISYLEYFVPYVWKCYRGKPLCAIDHGEWGGPDSCAARLCYCDLRLSRCLKQYACPGRRAVCRSSISRRLQNFLLVK